MRLLQFYIKLAGYYRMLPSQYPTFYVLIKTAFA